jgi:hypothetical protein
VCVVILFKCEQPKVSHVFFFFFSHHFSPCLKKDYLADEDGKT